MSLIYKSYRFFFFIIILQYLLIYLLGDTLNVLDELITFSLLPIFFLYITKENKYLLVSVTYILIKTVILFFIEARLAPTLLDLFSWFLKPLILFWSFIYIFEKQDKKFIDKTTKYLEYIFFIGVTYGILQFVLWFLFRVDLPMRSSNYLNASQVVSGDQFAFLRISSIFGQPLWYGYFCSLFGIYYTINKKYYHVVFAFMGLILAFSRWATFLFGLSVFFVVVSGLSKNKKILIYAILTLILVLLIPKGISIYDKIWGNYGDTAIKIYGIKKALFLIFHNPIGYGVGSYGTSNSIGSFTYNISHFDLSRLANLGEKKSGIEATVFIFMVQIGIDGLIAFILPFLKKLKKNKKSTVFYIFLILLPLVDIYSSLVITTAALLISKVNSDNTKLAESL